METPVPMRSVVSFAPPMVGRRNQPLLPLYERETLLMESVLLTESAVALHEATVLTPLVTRLPPSVSEKP